MDNSNDIERYLFKQLETLFYLKEHEKSKINDVLGGVLEKTLYCLSGRNDKYHEDKALPYLNPFNTCDYMIFLYFLSHELFLEREEGLASRIYYLNKVLNCVDLFYAIELPKVWGAEHPLSSVMGRAKYGEYFFFYQGCTVGAGGETAIRYPIIGENVTMLSNSKILGASHIGNNCIIAANAYINNSDIPDNSIVFGHSPDLKVKKRKSDIHQYATWNLKKIC